MARGKQRRSFEVVVESAGAREAVFDLLADGANWASWAGPLVLGSRWEREGDPKPGGVGAIRRLGCFPFIGREEVVESDRPRRHAYTLLSGWPVRDYVSAVELEPLASGGTRIVWRSSFVPKVPGTGAVLRIFSRMLLGSIAWHLAAAAGPPGR